MDDELDLILSVVYLLDSFDRRCNHEDSLQCQSMAVVIRELSRVLKEQLRIKRKRKHPDTDTDTDTGTGTGTGTGTDTDTVTGSGTETLCCCIRAVPN